MARALGQYYFQKGNEQVVTFKSKVFKNMITKSSEFSGLVVK